MPPKSSGESGTRQYSELEMNALIGDMTAVAYKAIEQAAAIASLD
jgi:hypothetical protein